MTAVVRLKRRFDEEPLEALVLACKRKKTDDFATTKTETPFTTILTFAGTVRNQVNTLSLLEGVSLGWKKFHCILKFSNRWK
jgi:hypothetical protein